VAQPITVNDGGLFLAAPSLFLAMGAGATTTPTIATLAAVMGGRPDIAIIQAAP
jgi:hypothetical protein